MLPEFSGDFIQWLRAFCVVAETKNIHKSSEILHRSPSTISLQIKKLEQELRRALFQRGPTGMALLPEGARLLEQTRSIISILDKICDDPDATKELSGLVVVSSMQRHAMDFLLAGLRRFRPRHERVQFLIYTASWEKLTQQVENFDASFGLTVAYDPPPGLMYTECYTAPLHLLMPRDNPFNITEESSWEDICALPFISVAPGIIHPWLARQPDIPKPHNVVITVEDAVLAIAYAKAGLGVCMAADPTPLAPLSEFSLLNLARFLPPLSVGVLRRKEGFLSPQADAFLRTLFDVAALYRQRGEGLDMIIDKTGSNKD